MTIRPVRWRGPFSVRRDDSLEYVLAVLTTMPVECTTWPEHYARHSHGYGRTRVDGRCVHVLVCTWYHGPRPPTDPRVPGNPQVRHLCGNGHLGCFTPAHLRWGTAAENAADRSIHRQ